MDKTKFFELSKQVMELAQDYGISPKTLKTYAGVLALSTASIVLGTLSADIKHSPFKSSPLKPTIEQPAEPLNTIPAFSFDDMRMFLNGDGQAKVFINPFSINESITIVHSDKYQSLADLNDQDKWAARVATVENINAHSPSYTYCKNGIDWNKPTVSLSGKCLTIMNLQQADSIFADVNSKSSLTIDDMRLFMLLHETAHGHSTTRSMSALHKENKTELYRNGFAEKQADLSAFFAISKALTKDNVNALFDALIKTRSDNSRYTPGAYDTHGLLLIAKNIFNESPDFFKETANEDILFKASLMVKVYNDAENKQVFFPNYQSDLIVPASIDGIVQRIQTKNNSESKTSLMRAIDLKQDQVSQLSKAQLTDVVMSNIDSINIVVESSRSITTFDDLINNHIETIAPHIDTSAFTNSLNKLLGKDLDTATGYNDSINKVAQSILMEQQ